VTWRVRPSDDAWREYQALDEELRLYIRENILLEWIETGPHHDRLTLENGVLFRELEITPSCTMVFIVPTENQHEQREVLILKFRVKL
jgi:hypothetical protein